MSKVYVSYQGVGISEDDMFNDPIDVPTAGELVYFGSKSRTVDRVEVRSPYWYILHLSPPHEPDSALVRWLKRIFK